MNMNTRATAHAITKLANPPEKVNTRSTYSLLRCSKARSNTTPHFQPSC